MEHAILSQSENFLSLENAEYKEPEKVEHHDDGPDALGGNDQ
jgi:hypothetical protein